MVSNLAGAIDTAPVPTAQRTMIPSPIASAVRTPSARRRERTDKRCVRTAGLPPGKDRRVFALTATRAMLRVVHASTGRAGRGLAQGLGEIGDGLPEPRSEAQE